MTKQYKKDYFEDRKLKFEKNHGVFVHEFMFTEFSNRILGQCNVALNDLQKQLDLEIARAKAEEERLDSKIDAEIARATAEETRLDGKIDAETTRATAEETRLDGKIDTEKTRLDGKIDEQALTNLNKINKVLKYSNLYYSLTYDINEIADNSKIKYPTIMLNGVSYETLRDSEKTLNETLNETFNAVATALNQISKRLNALENK